MVFDYRADGRCCTKMLSQPNLRSCSLRLRQAEGGRRRTGGKRNTRKREREKEKNKSKPARKKDTKDATPKMSIKAKRVKSSEERTKGRKGNRATGWRGGEDNRGHEKTTAERTHKAFLKSKWIFLKRLANYICV